MKSAFSFINEDTGNEFVFASEDAYEHANDWYNRTEKSEIIGFCSGHGVDLMERTDDPYFKSGEKLVDDWADRAMEVYARHSGAGDCV